MATYRGGCRTFPVKKPAADLAIVCPRPAYLETEGSAKVLSMRAGKYSGYGLASRILLASHGRSCIAASPSTNDVLLPPRGHPGTNQVAEFGMGHMFRVNSLWSAQVWGMGTADIGRDCHYPINHTEIDFENYTGRTGSNGHRKPWAPGPPPYDWQSRFPKPAPWTLSVQLPAW